MSALHDLWLLDGRGPYVWGSLLACALAFALELWGLRQRRRRFDTGADPAVTP